MYKTRSRWSFYYSLNRFLQRNLLVLPENDLIYKFMQRLHGFILNWTFLDFLDFYEKKSCKKKKIHQNYLYKQENLDPERIWKYSGKNIKISKPFEPFQVIRNLNFSPSANHAHGDRHFFKTLASNYFSIVRP